MFANNFILLGDKIKVCVSTVDYEYHFLLIEFLQLF